MNILITGGAGYLGSHVTHYLQSRARVTVYDNLLYTDEYTAPVNFIYADVTDIFDLSPALAAADVVIWLTAIVGDGACAVNPATAYRVNVEAVERAANAFTGPFIFMSTASVYGFYDGIADENSTFNPQSFYAETKVKAEELLVSRDDTLILRLATLHGASPRTRFDLVVNAMTRDAITKHLVTVHGGHQWRPLASVRDVAHFISCMALRTPAGVYNIVSQNLQVSDIANTVCSITGAEQNIIDIHTEDRRDYRMDGSKIGDRYRPVITVEDSAAELATMLTEGRIKNPYASKYINSKVIQETILYP